MHMNIFFSRKVTCPFLKLSQCLNSSCSCAKKWIIHSFKKCPSTCPSNGLHLFYIFALAEITESDYRQRRWGWRWRQEKDPSSIDPIALLGEMHLQRTWNQHSEFNLDPLHTETGGIHNDMESKTSKGMGWNQYISIRLWENLGKLHVYLFLYTVCI